MWSKRGFLVFFRQVLITSVLLLGACRPDRDRAQWDVEALTPILNSRLSLDDLFTDSVLTFTSDGQVSLVYRSKLGDFKFQRIDEAFDKDYSNTATLQNIDLGTRTITQTISMGQLAKRSGAAGAIVMINNGNNADIPPLDGFGPYSFNLDATNFFQTMTLRDGWLVVEISNEIPVEITNFQYLIRNRSGGADIMARNVASIMPGDLYRDSVRLENNIVVEGQIRTIIQNIDSPGSNGMNVDIDTSDVLDIRVTVKNLDPVQATAVFPDQILLSESENTEIENFRGQLTSMVVERGSMYLDATNTIEDELVFEYKIPSATLNGTPLEFDEIVPASGTSGPGNRYSEQDIAGYTVNLTGPPGSGLYNTFYTQTNARIDSSGRLITLSLQDSVLLKTGIIGLLASRSYGYLGRDTLNSTESVQGEILDILSNANQLALDEVLLSLEVENFIGAPLGVTFNNVEGVNAGGNRTSLNWNGLGQLQNVPAATENTPGNRPSPGLLQIPVNGGNSNITELLENQPKTFELDLNTYLNASVPTPVYDQFAYREYGITAYLTTELPLNLAFQNLLFADTSAFKYSGIDPKGQLQSGDLVLIGDNAFPFAVSVNMLLLDRDSTLLGTLSSPDVLQAAELDNNQRVSTAVKSQARYPLTPERIALLKNTFFIVFEARFSTGSYPQKVKIYNDNYLDLTLSGDLKLRTAK